MRLSAVPLLWRELRLTNKVAALKLYLGSRFIDALIRVITPIISSALLQLLLLVTDTPTGSLFRMGKKLWRPFKPRTLLQKFPSLKSTGLQASRGPRLYNAKQRIRSGRRISVSPAALKDIVMSPSSHERLSDDPMWQEIATPDLIKYFDTAKLSPQERLKCLRNPARYFAFPRNVPVELRKQIYLYAAPVLGER